MLNLKNSQINKSQWFPLSDVFKIEENCQINSKALCASNGVDYVLTMATYSGSIKNEGAP